MCVSLAKGLRATRPGGFNIKTRTLPSAVLLAPLLAGCGDSRRVSPTEITTPGGPSLAVTPSTLSAQAVQGAFCPAIPPFDVPFHLIVTSTTVVTVTDVT